MLTDEYEKRKAKEKEKRRLEEEKKKRFVIPKKVSGDSNNNSPASAYSNPESIQLSNEDVSPGRDTDNDLSDSKGYTSLKDKREKSHNRNHNSHSQKEESSRPDKEHRSRSGHKSNSASDITNKDRERSSSKHKHGSHSTSSNNYHSSGKSGDSSDSKEKSNPSSSDKLNTSHSKSSHSSETQRKHSSSSSHRHISSKHSSELSSESSSKHKHSSSKSSSSKSSHHSSSSSKSSDKVSKVSKVSAQDLSLEELRAQVKQLKQDLEPIKEKETEQSALSSSATPNMFQPYKNRQGVELDESEKRKAQILTKTQMILQRTKEKLAREQEEAKKPKKRLGKSSAGGSKKEKDSSGQIKSRSLCRDSESEDEDGPVNLNFENNFNEEYLTQEPGSILKTIKNKIDEKLSSYNFPEKPAKEKPVKEKKEKLVKEKILKEKIKKDKYKDKHKDKRDSFEDTKIHSSNSSEDIKQTKVKKNKFFRRHQTQPPPMNFQDLLKLAEEKTKEKVIEPVESVFKIPKKKEERPMTQEERDRLERQKESRRRVREEELEFKKRKMNGEDINSDPLPVHKTDNADRVHAWLSENKKSSQSLPEKDGSKLKAALTGNHRVPILEQMAKPGMISSKPAAFSKQIQEKEKGKPKYDSENENVLSCGPSSSSKPSSKPANPYKGDSVNPWDRITAGMQKNPKLGNFKFVIIVELW